MSTDRALADARRIIDEAERDAEIGKIADHAFWPETAVTVARALLALSAEVERLKDALKEMEEANQALCAARPQAVYDALIRAGQADLLGALDSARKKARTALTPPSSQPGNSEVTR